MSIVDGRCNNCGKPTTRAFGVWEIASCSQGCDNAIDASLDPCDSTIDPSSRVVEWKERAQSAEVLISRIAAWDCTKGTRHTRCADDYPNDDEEWCSACLCRRHEEGIK